MYKLLLATDRPEIAEAFAAVTSWETLGFRKPRVVTSAADAVACLLAHHADGIAIALNDQDAGALYDHLLRDYPLLPILDATAKPGEVERSVTELGKLLNRTHADYCNENFGEADLMQLCRHDFFRALIAGRIHEKRDVRRYLKLLRSRMCPDRACVLLRLALPEDKNYLKGRWHYGSERLEVALRNFFGAELNGMRMLVAVLPDERIYLLACPMLGEDGGPDDESMTSVIANHAGSAIEHVREYLDLDLTIAGIEVYQNITELAREH